MTPRDLKNIHTIGNSCRGTLSCVQHGTETIPIFLSADGEALWSVLPCLVSLLYGGKVQPENTYSFILKVTGQVWVYQKGRSINTDHILALIQAVFNISDHFWVQGNWHPINKKTFSFQDRFCFLKAHAHYFTALIYFANWRAAKLGIFAHFIFTNSPQCNQRINSPIYVYSTQIASCFLWVLDHSHDSTSSYCYRPKKCLYYPLTATSSIYHPKPVTTDHLTIKSGLVSTNPMGKDEVRGWLM